MTPTRAFEADAPLGAFALAPSGAEMCAVLKSGKTQVWSAAGKPLRSWTSGDRPPGALYYAGEHRIAAVAGGSLLLLDAASGRKIAAWEAHKDDIENVASLPDGSLLATASDDGTVKLWKPDGGLLRTLQGGDPVEMLGVAVAPAGGRIAGASADTSIRLFDAGGGAVLRVLDLPMCCPVLDFSPDGRTLAAGSVDGSVTLWDAESGASRGTLGRHAAPVGAIRFSADGRRLASVGISMNPATVETEAKVWDMATRKETITPIGVAHWDAVGFAPGGRPFAVSIEQRTISVWEMAFSA